MTRPLIPIEQGADLRSEYDLEEPHHNHQNQRRGLVPTPLPYAGQGNIYEENANQIWNSNILILL